MTNYFFGTGSAPDPIERADVDDSGTVNINDLLILINYILSEGSPPPYRYTGDLE